LVFAGVALVQWVCHWQGASPEMLRMASLGSIVFGNLVLLLWFRSLGARGHAHGNAVFWMLLLGVCAVFSVLIAVPGAGSVFGPPADLSPWAWGLAVPAGWAGWRWLALARKR
jgi:Ca2+-transporting ATPase